MRTSEFTEKQLPKIARLLGFENEPKWVTIRFAIFISLSLNQKINYKEKIDFGNGKNYNLEVITGKGKLDITGSQADYTSLIALYLANSDNIQIKNEKDLEKRLEFHCERGFRILSASLNDSSDIYEWIKEEFLFRI